MSFPEWQYRVCLDMPHHGDDYGRTRIKATAGLRYLPGNRRPYFSVTGEIYIPGRRDCESCGQLHDDLLRHFPELQPVINLHLADDRGVPMHASANGLFHAGVGRYAPGPNVGAVSRVLRLSRAAAAELVQQVRAARNVRAPLWHWFIESQRPRWRAEAAAAVLRLRRLAGGAQ